MKLSTRIRQRLAIWLDDLADWIDCDEKEPTMITKTKTPREMLAEAAEAVIAGYAEGGLLQPKVESTHDQATGRITTTIQALGLEAPVTKHWCPQCHAFYYLPSIEPHVHVAPWVAAYRRELPVQIQRLGGPKCVLCGAAVEAGLNCCEGCHERTEKPAYDTFKTIGQP